MTHVTVNLNKQECEELHASAKMLLDCIKQLLADQGDYRTTKPARTIFGLCNTTIVDFNQTEAQKEIRSYGLGDFFTWKYNQYGKVTGFEYASSVTKLKAMLMMLEIGIEQGSLELVIEAEQGYLFVYTYLIRLVAEQKKG